MVTISTVEATRPERLSEAAEHLGARVTRITDVITTLDRTLTGLQTSWTGAAADAAIAKGRAEIARQRSIADRLTAMRNPLASAGTNLTALRNEIVSMKEQVNRLGGTVADDGTVTPAVPQFGLQGLLTPAACEAYTSSFKALLTEFDNIDKMTAASLDLARSGPVDASMTGPKWTGDDLYEGDPSAADINQNALGDCYLAATAGAIAEANPQWIKDRISYNSTTGEFDVTLWDGEQWRHIPVTQADIDANIAASGGSGVDTGDPTTVDRGDALWPAVLESAYGKLTAPGKAPYTGIGQGGYSKDAMQALTGNRGTTLDPEQQWYRDLNVDQQIAQATGNHQPVVLSTTGDTGSTNLVPHHVYTVVGIEGTGSDAKVTLRNPWEPSDGNGQVTVRLGDLMGRGLAGARGDGPVQDFNIGNLG